jgi:N-acetylmuramoyl-L-alanine amidase
MHATPIDPERVRVTRQYLELHNPPLAAALPAGDGPEAIAFVPRMIVVHFTAIPTLAGTLDAFRGARLTAERPDIRAAGELNVGVQFVVDRDGTIYSLLPETVIGRHAIGLNHVAIGIENVGDGDLGARRASAPLTRQQLAANVALVRHLVAAHPTIRVLVGHHELPAVERPDHPAHHLFHEEVAGYRTVKVDPGRRFMARLRAELRRVAAR